MIQLTAIGHLGADAEVKTINEKQYISFRIASTDRRNDQDETTWINVLISDNPKLLPYLKKGQQVFIQGRLKVSMYQTQQNVGIDISVFASTLQLCGGKKEESTTSNQATYGSTVAPSAGTNVVPSSSTAKPATVPDPSITAFGNYAQENMTSPFPPAVDDNGNAKSDDLPF